MIADLQFAIAAFIPVALKKIKTAGRGPLPGFFLGLSGFFRVASWRRLFQRFPQYAEHVPQRAIKGLSTFTQTATEVKLPWPLGSKKRSTRPSFQFAACNNAARSSESWALKIASGHVTVALSR